MSTKHTPGPWAFCNDTLCQATGNYLHLGKYTESSGLGRAAEANKALIAAAPELLSALQLIIEETGERDNTGTLGRIYTAAAAAIAKTKQ